jgi:hypothetical protein
MAKSACRTIAANRDGFHFGYAAARVSSVGRAISLLLCLGACRTPGPAAAAGPAYPRLPEPVSPAAPTASTSAAPALAPPSSASAAPAAAAQFGTTPFAGKGPILVERASGDARWVALCQAEPAEVRAATPGAPPARESGALQRFLVAPGAELAIDAWLGASPNGRFVLVLQRGALVLWDSETSHTLDLSALGADSRLSAESNAALRTVDFDATSEQLLYVRRAASGPRIVLRNLADGSERELDPGPGEIWRARFDPGGAFVNLQMISADTNKNGKFDFPAPLLAAPRACGDPLPHFRAWENRGDRPETVLLPLAGGTAIHEPELVQVLGDALLLRDENGALLLEQGQRKRVLANAECKGRMVHADRQRELFIVGCAQKKKTGRVSLELVTREGRKPLNLELASVELDREPSDSPRLVALYPGSDSYLFDADKRELIALQPGDSVLGTHLARALVRRGKALLVYDADQRRERPLAGVVDKYPDILRALPFVFVSPLLVNLETAEIVGVSKQRPLALSATGQLLLADTDPDPPHLARGPLHWSAPTPPAHSAP